MKYLSLAPIPSTECSLIAAGNINGFHNIFHRNLKCDKNQQMFEVDIALPCKNLIFDIAVTSGTVPVLHIHLKREESREMHQSPIVKEIIFNGVYRAIPLPPEADHLHAFVVASDDVIKIRIPREKVSLGTSLK